MKRCPTCNRTFTDRNLSFCIDDGTPLVETTDEATVVSPSPEAGRSGRDTADGTPVYQPPGSYVPPGSPPGKTKRKAWPWVVGILVIIVLLLSGLVIGAVILIPRMRSGPSNSNVANANTNSSRDNRNANLSSTEDEKPESVDETPAPTDEQAVLAELTELEHEWTVANINADKKKLARILADDYVGTSENGKSQGKAEYLRTIERDTAIQKWEFEDLRVSLNGDRATLNGIIKLQIQDHPIAYRFTDKFVWRDGRWQATGSEVTLVKE